MILTRETLSIRRKNIFQSHFCQAKISSELDSDRSPASTLSAVDETYKTRHSLFTPLAQSKQYTKIQLLRHCNTM